MHTQFTHFLIYHLIYDSSTERPEELQLVIRYVFYYKLAQS